jgi:nucleotide-binding universal stress UspA family protein
MSEGVDRWENEGDRDPSQAGTATDVESYLRDGGRAIQRLLFVADAAVADVDQLPPPVRAVIDAAAAVYVLTPTLPGRLAWLADEVDEVRHVADERLDTVLGHLHSIRAHATGVAARGSLMTVVAEAVAEFKPDHILLALRSSGHANWQERGLVKHIEQRFGLPVTTYAVDAQGHASSADGPLLLCFDGSDDARRAIERAGALFAGRHALVVTVWQPVADLDGLAWTGAIASRVDVVEFNRAAAGDGARVADEGVRIALAAGLRAEPCPLEASGSVWRTIVELADRHDAAAIVMGSRGLTGLRSMLLGSVSSAVVHHAGRPTLVIRHPVAA